MWNAKKAALMLSTAIAISGFGLSAAQAADNACTVVFAHGAAISSMDPHFHAVDTNGAIAEHIYSKLLNQDENLRVSAGLAESWEQSTEDPKVWTFKLRQDVKWHDGSPFTAHDVAYTFERVPNVENSPGTYAIYTTHVAKVEVIDDHTLQLTTKDIFPLTPQYAALLTIVSKAASEGKTTADFNSGLASIGTGPYKFKEYVPGERIVLERNEDFWGVKPQAKEIEFRFISNNATRVAALLAGDVDIIDRVPTTDAAQLSTRDGIHIESVAGVRNIYLYLDQGRDPAPFVTDNNGQPLAENPFKDLKVRQALSKAINREAIVAAVMNGQASPSGQLLPAGVMGHVDEMTATPYDPEGAKALLAEAGYPDGFKVTLFGPNDRYINDAEVVQAVAQMWSRIGVATTVDTMPSSVYFTRAGKLEFSAGLLGWGTGTGEPDSPMSALLRSGGTTNRSLYSNPTFDEMLDEALATVDVAEREKLYQAATQFVIDDLAIVPLHHQFNIWGMREGLNYLPQVNEMSLARNISFTDEACE